MVNMEGFSVVEEVLEAMGEDLEDYTVMEEILEEVVVVLVEVVV
jgi:predicted DNA-binding protein